MLYSCSLVSRGRREGSSYMVALPLRGTGVGHNMAKGTTVAIDSFAIGLSLVTSRYYQVVCHWVLCIYIHIYYTLSLVFLEHASVACALLCSPRARQFSQPRLIIDNVAQALLLQEDANTEHCYNHNWDPGRWQVATNSHADLQGSQSCASEQTCAWQGGTPRSILMCAPPNGTGACRRCA